MSDLFGILRHTALKKVPCWILDMCICHESKRVNTLRADHIYMSYTLILTFFTLEIFWKFSKNKSSLSACASDRGGSKDSKNGFNFLLAQKLRELEHFEIFKILSKNCRFSKNTAARNGLMRSGNFFCSNVLFSIKHQVGMIFWNKLFRSVVG